MNNLWAPWRMRYIQNIDKKEENCIFCTKITQQNDRENLIIHRGTYCYIIMNLYPYNNGHLMVIPYRHTSQLLDLEPKETEELWRLLGHCQIALKAKMNPEGFNIGMNIGRNAGAGIDQHIHMHIVPRWNGDTNFMPVVGATKVISQALEDTYDALLPYFQHETEQNLDMNQ